MFRFHHNRGTVINSMVIKIIGAAKFSATYNGVDIMKRRNEKRTKH
jgi:hypothetical protein